MTYKQRLETLSKAMSRATKDASPTDAQGIIRYLVFLASLELRGGHFSDEKQKQAIEHVLLEVDGLLEIPLAPIGS